VFVLALDKVDPELADWVAGGLDRATFANSYWNVAAFDLYNIAGRWTWNGDQVAIYSAPSPTAVFHDPPPSNGVMGMEIGIKKPGDPKKAVRTALDPLRVDPKDFKLEFENSQVRVMRVRMAPRLSVPMHEYALNRVVFYLTGQNVRETSPDGKAKVAGYKAGDYTWDDPAKYKAEDLSDKPFEALVVELRN
jgi:hypothetical protein